MDLSDIGGLLKHFGVDLNAVQETLSQPQAQEQIAAAQEQMMQAPGFADMLGKLDGIAAQGGIMPDDVEQMAQSMGGMDGLMSQMGGGAAEEAPAQ